MLIEHNRRSLATVPSIVEKFSQLTIDKKMKKAGDISMMPLSHIDISGCEDCTLVSSVFISEIPHTSLEVVYASVLAYFGSIAATLKRHLGVDTTTQLLNSAESPVHYLRSSFKRPQGSWTENYVLCSDLTPAHGMVHIDAVTDDPLCPVSASASWQYSICGLTVTPRKHKLTGRTLSVTLRWVVVYRYETMPNDPAIQADLEIIRPILNGDLITASVCNYIQELQEGRKELSFRKTWRLEEAELEV